MRLRLSGGNLANHLLSRRVDNFHRVAYLGGHVQQPIGTEFCAMRANWPHWNRPRNLALADIDDVNCGAIGTWFAHPGISINGNVDEARVGRDSSFMTANADGDGREDAVQVRFYE